MRSVRSIDEITTFVCAGPSVYASCNVFEYVVALASKASFIYPGVKAKLTAGFRYLPSKLTTFVCEVPEPISLQTISSDPSAFVETPLVIPLQLHHRLPQ